MNDEQSLREWLIQLAANTLAQEGGKDTAHDVDHVARTMALADTLHAQEGGELPTILAAAALHDVGQERERRTGGDHAVLGAEMTADLLANTRFPQEAIPAVQQAIREHRTTGSIKPQTLEGKIVYDADKLDSLGAVGVARLYSITGMLNQRIYVPTPEGVTRPVDPEALLRLRASPDYSSSIEFDLLLADLPDQMMTPTGRRLARIRHDYSGFQMCWATRRGRCATTGRTTPRPRLRLGSGRSAPTTRLFRKPLYMRAFFDRLCREVHGEF